MVKLIDKGSIPPDDPFFNASVELFRKHAYKPAKRFGIISWHEGEPHSQPDSAWTVNFAYFRRQSPKGTPQLAEPTPVEPKK